MIGQIGGFLLAVVVWSIYRIQFLRAQQKNREAVVYGGLMGVASILGSLLLAGVNIPSMVVPYEMIFEPIGRRLLQQ